MTQETAEDKFKKAVFRCFRADEYPGRWAMTSRGIPVGTKGFNGRQCRWREECFEQFMKSNPNHRITIKRSRLRVQKGSE